MPGITTMWIGAAARGVWSIGRRLGLWSRVADVPFARSDAGLASARVGVAVVTSVLIGLLCLLVMRWVDRRAAIVAGVLLATEPFLVAHGALLHTDELWALFGVSSMVATCLALGVPHRTSWAGRWWASVLAGALFGGALLTKVSALMLLASVMLLGAWAALAAMRASRTGPSDRAAGNQLGEVLRSLGLWVVSAAMTFVVAYPALWVQPRTELQRINQSAHLGASGHENFFMGKLVMTPGPSFYFVALPFRMTPWLLIGVLVGGIAIWWLRRTAGIAVALTCFAVPSLVVLSLASKQFDRYGLHLLVIAAIVVGVAVTAIVGAVGLDGTSTRGGVPITILSAAAVILLAAHSLAVAPWGLAYFNPALGGGRAAERRLLVGWGEGLEQADAFIASREANRCSDVRIWTYRVYGSLPCGTFTTSWAEADYIIMYIARRQRLLPNRQAELVANRELLMTVTIRGIDYADVYGPVGADGDVSHRPSKAMYEKRSIADPRCRFRRTFGLMSRSSSRRRPA